MSLFHFFLLSDLVSSLSSLLLFFYLVSFIPYILPLLSSLSLYFLRFILLALSSFSIFFHCSPHLLLHFVFLSFIFFPTLLLSFYLSTLSLIGKYYVITDGPPQYFWKVLDQAVIAMGFTSLFSKFKIPGWLIMGLAYLVVFLGNIFSFLSGTILND